MKLAIFLTACFFLLATIFYGYGIIKVTGHISDVGLKSIVHDIWEGKENDR